MSASTADTPPADVTATPSLPYDQPIYIGPHPDGGHMVLAGGWMQNVPTESLTHDLVNQAFEVNKPQSPSGAGQSFGINADRAFGTEPPSSLGAESVQSAPGAPWGERLINAVTPQPGPTTDQTGGQVAANTAENNPPPPGETEKIIPDNSKPPPAKPAATGGGSSQQGALDKAEQRKELGAGLEEQNESDIARQQLATGQQAAKSMQAAEDTRQLATAAAQKGAQDTLSKSAAIADKFAGETVTPHSYWANKNTGETIQAGIGLVLSTIGSGLGGGPNQALAAMNRVQDRDLEIQKYNIQHDKEASDQYRNLYQDYRQAGMDADAAFKATDLSIKAKQDQENQNTISAHGGQTALAKYLQATADQRTKLQQDKAALAKTVTETAGESINNQMGAINLKQAKDLEGYYGATMGKPGGPGPTDDQRKAYVRDAISKGNFINGIGPTTRKPTDEDLKKHQTFQLVNSLMDDLDQAEKGGGQIYSTKAAAKAQVLSGVLPQILNLSAKESEGVQRALGEIVVQGKAGRGFARSEHSQALRSTVSEAATPFYESLGVKSPMASATDAQAKAGGAIARR